MGKRHPDINQHGPLRNTFPFANVSSFCQVLYLGCPKPKAGGQHCGFSGYTEERCLNPYSFLASMALC